MKAIRLLAVLETSTSSGPAKNLLQFASMARADRLAPAVDLSIVTFRRNGDADLLTSACRELRIPLHVIPERGPSTGSSLIRSPGWCASLIRM